MRNQMEPLLILGPPVASATLGGVETPAWLRTPEVTFYWNEELGCYKDSDGRELYVEPYLSNGIITEDSYYELP